MANAKRMIQNCRDEVAADTERELSGHLLAERAAPGRLRHSQLRQQVARQGPLSFLDRQ